MSIDSGSTSKFLDDKFIPLSKAWKIGIGLFCIFLPIVIFIFFFYMPAMEEIDRLQKEKTVAKKALQTAKDEAARLPEFEEQAAQSKLNFEIAAAKLPKEKEVPQLLKDISALGKNSGLDFQSFKPLAERTTNDFYSEIPISIKVRGPYHNVGFFFDQINKLDRIVSVDSVQMGSPKREEGEMLLSSTCTLVTYRFTNVKLEPKGKKKK